jgi:hypothetical protein
VGDILQKNALLKVSRELRLDNNLGGKPSAPSWHTIVCHGRLYFAWARIGQVLRRENAPPRASAKFYKTIVQSILLYGSKTWVLSPTVMARLEGFHIRAVYRMAKKHVPRRGPDHQWVYPLSEAVLEECGMHTIQHYIDVQRKTIAKYVVGCSIFAECQGADRRRGSVPRQWWWEQRMTLEDV